MFKQIISGTVLASFSLSATLAGAAAKYTKKESEIQATQTALTKPVQVKKDEKSRPNINADDVFGGVGEKVKSITDQQTKILQRLIENTSDTDPEKPDLLFRMAELYNEQQRYYNFRARELDAKIYDAQVKGDQPAADKMKSQQVDYQKKEQVWLLEAVKKYIEVADHRDRYGSYKKMDEVLFYLAYLLTQVKKEEGARKYFKILIKDYPNSKFIADAWLSFGEFYFEQKDMEKALQFYEKVMQYPQSRVYGYAMYKQGWVYFNLGDFKGALATFVKVIELTQHGGGSSNKANRLALEKEAKKDVVRAYARLPGANPEKAWPFFQKVGGDYAMTMMEQLGELYNSQGMFGESIKTYRQLMTLAPNSPKLCSWQNEVMRNTLSATGSRAAPDTVKELQRLAAVYDKVKDEKNIKKEALDECRDNTANTLRELATVWHKEAQKTNNNDTYALAQYLYKEYIKNFPKEKDSYVMNFWYAELLWKLGSNGDNNKFCEAAPQYTHVVEMDPQPNAKYLKESAYAAVLAWKNCLSVEDSKEDAGNAHGSKLQETANAKKSAKGSKEEITAEKVFAPKPIPDRQMKMIAAFDTYIKYVPDSNELPTIKYRKARIYYEYDHLDEALPLFEEIADKHRSSDLAIYSANLMLDILAIKKNYKKLEEKVDDFYASPELTKDQEFKAQLAKLKAGVQRMQIAELEKAGKNKEAAAMYIQVATDYPDDPKIDEVYYNAAVLFDKANLIGLAIQARQQLLKIKPDSVLAKKAIFSIGRNYQNIAAFELAAENYETFANKFPGEKESATALYSASMFRRGLGENDKSIADVKDFIKLYGGRKEFVDKAAGVEFDTAQIFEQQKNNDALKKHFTAYLKEWGTKGGVDRQIVAHAKLGEILWKESCSVAGVNGACIELTRVRAAGAARVAAEKEAKKAKGKKGHKKGANLPAQCGPETKSKIAVHDRGPAKAKEALSHFAEALKLFKGGAADKNVPGKDEAERSARVNLMNYYAAEARMVEGDVEYEKFLKMNIPDKLDFSPAPQGASPAKEKAAKKRLEENQKKFKKWNDDKIKQLQNAQKVYQSVILFKQAHWAIAASARIGQLFQDYSGQLYTAPVPKAGSAPAGYDQAEFDQYFHDAYCDAMTDQAEPLETKAIEGLSTCLNKSTELSWFNEWSQLCEAELNQLKPNEYPLASEIRAEPGYVSVQTDHGVVQSLPETN
jgi:tetratricopeptide (TPR) repeat protein